MISQRTWRFGFAAFLLLASATTAARADSICAGTMTGSVLQPLPKPTTVSVAQPVSDDANPGLTQDFLNGFQAGGQTMLPPGQGNTQLDMTFTVNAGPSASSNAYKGFGWMSGMQAPPGGSSALPGSAVSISIEATDLTSQTLAWIGTISCTVQTADPDQLATHIGELVARALGRSMERRSF